MLQTTRFSNPAWEAFASNLEAEGVFLQVLIERLASGFSLRHVVDRGVPADRLRLMPHDGLRPLTQNSPTGAFRPLKSAPNLASGWLTSTTGNAQLGLALEQLYPGAVADWHALRQSTARVTPYREFTNRQTGMYRATARLSDGQAAAVIKACCRPSLCLKRRLWTVDGLEPDQATEGLAAPCLEICPIVLEFARNTARMQPAIPGEFAPQEIETLRAAIEGALALPEPSVREADFSEPLNSRRLWLMLEKLEALAGSAGQSSGPTDKH